MMIDFCQCEPTCFSYGFIEQKSREQSFYVAESGKQATSQVSAQEVATVRLRSQNMSSLLQNLRTGRFVLSVEKVCDSLYINCLTKDLSWFSHDTILCKVNVFNIQCTRTLSFGCVKHYTRILDTHVKQESSGQHKSIYRVNFRQRSF